MSRSLAVMASTFATIRANSVSKATPIAPEDIWELQLTNAADHRIIHDAGMTVACIPHRMLLCSPAMAA